MRPWLVFVSPCSRENVVATCQIWSFLCNLDNSLIIFFLEIKLQTGAHLKKKAIFDLLLITENNRFLFLRN